MTREPVAESSGHPSLRRPMVALLVGGQSRRFGSDKASQEIDGRSFQSLILEAVDHAELPVLLVGGSPERAVALGRRHAPDFQRGARGPTAGLATALTIAKAEGRPGVVLLACDQPGLTRQLLEAICQEAATHLQAPWALEGPTGLEPFPAYYPVEALPAVLGATSLRGALAAADPPVRIAKRDDQTEWPHWALDNINTPDDLAHHLARRSSHKHPDEEAKSSGC